MDMDNLLSYVVIGMGALVLTAVLWPRRLYRLPPGPPGLPILGNLLQLPKEFLQFRLTEMGKEYGGVFSLKVLGQPWLVLNDAKSAADVLDRKSGSTSNRPAWIKGTQFLSRNNGMVVAPHGPDWRLFRKGSHEALNIRACTTFHPMQEEEAAILVKGLLQHPDIDLKTHLSRAASSVVWRALYGGESLALNQPHDSHRIEEMMGYLLKSSLPLNSVVDLIPPLKHIVARSKFLRRTADRFYEEITAIYTHLYDGARSIGTTASPSVCQIFQKLNGRDGVRRIQNSWSAGSLFMAGQDTTATTLRWFVQAMLLYPEVAKTAQKELDGVVGDRPPTFLDKDRLPYIHALVKEVLRWRPSAPLSIPHCASEDFEYDGYLIPKGTFIVDNLWAIMHDPLLYDEPEVFKPSRFLNESGQSKRSAPDTHEDYLGFGHGRRVCPGRDLAINSLYIMVAYLLWALEFKKAKDEVGNEITPNPMDMIDMFIAVHPKPFEVQFVPRSADVLDKLA